MRSVEPHEGHTTLGHWQKQLQHAGGALDIITQNIDDLHERGGSEVLALLHGSTLTFRCFDCKAPSNYKLSASPQEQLEEPQPLNHLRLEDQQPCPSRRHG